MSARLTDLGWNERWSAQAATLTDLPGNTRPTLSTGPRRAHRPRTIAWFTPTTAARPVPTLGPVLDPAPTTGDWVLLDETEHVIHRRAPPTDLRRPRRRWARCSRSGLAANVDVIFVMAALSASPALSRWNDCFRWPGTVALGQSSC